MPTEQTVFRLASDVTHQTLGPGENTVILALRSGYFYTCNETTALFLQAVDGKRTLAGIVDGLLEQLDVPRETLSRDLMELAVRLLEEGLTVEVT